jgi:hypothetical protein
MPLEGAWMSMNKTNMHTPFVSIYLALWVKSKSIFVKFDKNIEERYQHPLYHMHII